MKLNMRTRGLSLGLALLSLPALADQSLGPEPYADGYGFDRPEEASWGGWTRGQAGTLHVEWDVFKDESHGGKDDRTALADVASFGVSSAWAGWNVGTFISSTLNLYSFSVPETVRLNLAPQGGLPAPLRVVLQVESQGEGTLDSRYLRLNGRGPNRVQQTHRALYTSSQGPVELAHYQAIFDLEAVPALIDVEFSMAQHTTIRQIAIDAGPVKGAVLPADPSTSGYQTQKAQINLAPETLDSVKVTELFAQNPKFFPQVWPSTQLSFVQTATTGGDKAKRQLKGKIKGLFYDSANGNAQNAFRIDLYRTDGEGTRRLAECRMVPRKMKRWAKVTLDGKEMRLGTADYTLSLTSDEQDGKTQLRKGIGTCDVDLSTPGIQSGIPLLKDGDEAVLIRP